MNITELISTLTQKTDDYLSRQSSRVKAWREWYEGTVQGFHEYYIYNGQKKVYMKKKTLHMAKKIPEDFADLLFNDNCKVLADSPDKTDKLGTILDSMNFKDCINAAIEKSFALGTGAVILRKDADSSYSIDFVYADSILPITVQNGIIKECGFKTTISKEGRSYAYFSIHRLVNGRYVIENALYSVSPDGTIGAIDSRWVYNTGSETPWFAVLKPNATNNFEDYSSYGISIFANSISTLEAIDESFTGLNQEIMNGKLKILVSADLINYGRDGVLDTFDTNDVVFQTLPKGTNEETKIEIVAPVLRTDNFISALNSQLKILSSQVGLGNDFYTFDSNVGLKTATEVISKDSQMFRRIKKHEIVLDSALVPFVKSIAQTQGITTEVEIDFDDSIVQDKEAERSQDLRDMTAGLMPAYQYRMKWYDEDEATARKAIEEADIL